jgi:hypothetical protein
MVHSSICDLNHFKMEEVYFYHHIVLLSKFDFGHRTLKTILFSPLVVLLTWLLCGVHVTPHLSSLSSPSSLSLFSPLFSFLLRLLVALHQLPLSRRRTTRRKGEHGVEPGVEEEQWRQDPEVQPLVLVDSPAGGCAVRTRAMDLPRSAGRRPLDAQLQRHQLRRVPPTLPCAGFSE